MKILDRYILSEFMRTFIGILCVLTVILLLKEVLSDLASYLEENPPALQVFLYFIYVIPEELLFALPITVILAMMFSLGNLSKNKEILAIHACGVSYLRVARPLIVAIGLVTAGHYLARETIVPFCAQQARYIKEVVFEGEKESTLSESGNVTTKGAGNKFYTMTNFDSRENKMEYPTITELSEDGGEILWRIEARSGQLVERDPKTDEWHSVSDPRRGKNYSWEFRDAHFREFDPENNYNVKTYLSVDIMYKSMEENLDRFLSTNKKVEQMNLFELAARCRAERDKGDYRFNLYYYELQATLHQRLAMPLATFLLGMIGYSFAVRSSIRSLVLEFGMALLSILLYYGLSAFGEKLGSNNWAPPIVAVWFTNVLFIVLLVFRFRALEHVPRS